MKFSIRRALLAHRLPHRPHLPPLQPLHCLRPLVALPALALGLLLCAVPARAALADDVAQLLAAGRGAEALQRTEQALLVTPRDAQTRFVHGVVLMELGRDAEALAQFTRLAQEFPELPEPLNNIALLHARAGRLEAARATLESALRNDPGHRAARANLAEVHLMLAAAAWEQLAQAAPLEARLARRLEAVRALLAAPGR
jgi:Flp pilus assembly protein TadD